MSSKSLPLLAIITAVALGLALWLAADRGVGNQPNAADTALIPGLRSSLNDVTALVVSTRNQKASMTLGEDGWVVNERGGYPADTGTIREQLIALGGANIVERKTSNPEFYSELGVGDPSEQGEGGVSVQVVRGDNTAEIIVGDGNLQRSGTTYVRRAEEAQSLLVNGSYRFDVDPLQWLAKDIVDIPANRIRRLIVSREGAVQLEAVKAFRDESQFLVTNMPDGRELTSPSAAGSVASSLASLRLDDVMAVEDIEQPTGAETTTVFETFDGLRVIATAWEAGDKRYLQLGAEFDDSVTIPVAADEQADGEVANDLTADEESAPDVASEAQALSNRVNGWVYVIPSYKFDNITKTVEDLLKPLETATEDDG